MMIRIGLGAVIPVFLGASLGLASTAGIQGADPGGSPRGDPVPSIDEPAFLVAEAKGDISGALGGYRDALLQVVSKGDAATKEDNALAEYLLGRYLYFVRWTDTSGKAKETLSEIWNRSDLDPVLSGRVGLGLSDAMLRLGDAKGCAEISGKLGFITDWLVCGSFDNERGGGFDDAYPPEKEFRADATYKGKKRAVRWVGAPAKDPRGWIDLNGMLRPNEECLAYATTFIRSDGDRPAALHLGSDEGLKV